MKWLHWLSITFFLFVVSTMISQSAMDGFAILSAISLIGYWFSQKRSFPLFPKTKVEIPFLLFSVAVVLSFLFNWNTQSLAVSRIVELKWILNFYLIVATLQVLQPKWHSLQRVQIFIWISALFALTAPILGYDLIQGIQTGETATKGLVRVGGFFSNPMTFAHLHALFFFLVGGVALCFWKDRQKGKWLESALAAVLGLALLLTLTRGVWISVFFGLVLMGFLVHKRWGFAILLTSLLLAVGLFFFVPSIQERALQFLAANSYDGERVWIWKANWQIFLDHPVFGIGYGQNTLALKEYYLKIGAPEGLLISHSHNQFLHILAGLGVFGLASYLAMVLSFFIISLKSYFQSLKVQLPSWKQGLLLGSIGAQLNFILGGLTESNFEHSKVRYVLLLVWAIPLWILSEQKQSDRKHE